MPTLVISKPGGAQVRPRQRVRAVPRTVPSHQERGRVLLSERHQTQRAGCCGVCFYDTLEKAKLQAGKPLSGFGGPRGAEGLPSKGQRDGVGGRNCPERLRRGAGMTTHSEPQSESPEYN